MGGEGKTTRGCLDPYDRAYNILGELKESQNSRSHWQVDEVEAPNRHSSRLTHDPAYW